MKLRTFAVVVSLLFLTGCQTMKVDGYSGAPDDINLLVTIKNNSDKYESDRSILWVEKGYLSKAEADYLQGRIDKGIVDIENFTGIPFDKDAYGKDKIEYFVHGRPQKSHTITRYEPRKHMHPVIFLTWAYEEKAPYIHETTHIIAWDWNSLWPESVTSYSKPSILWANLPHFSQSSRITSPDTNSCEAS